MVGLRNNIVPGQAVAHTGKGATVNCYDLAAGFRRPHQFGHIASDACDTGHFSLPATVKLNCQMVGHLRGA